MSRSVWSAGSLLPLSHAEGGRKREQAPRTPYASRGRRLKCSQAFPEFWMSLLLSGVPSPCATSFESAGRPVAKEVGMGNPAGKTTGHPTRIGLPKGGLNVKGFFDN